MRILKLDKTGRPEDWVSREDAAIMYAKGQVLWELGSVDPMLGGTNRISCEQSRIDIAPIIAVDGRVLSNSGRFALTNETLFKRDNHQCMYCGEHFHRSILTRDHITPRVQGGLDVWENVITACKRCNNAKGGRTPEQASMELLAIPFAPNLCEYFYLRGHKILADQMEFLSSKFSGKRDWK